MRGAGRIVLPSPDDAVLDPIPAADMAKAEAAGLGYADAVAHGLQRVALETDKPVLFGVLTCDTLEQARARALPADQGGSHDKGREVARAAVAALAALERAVAKGYSKIILKTEPLLGDLSENPRFVQITTTNDEGRE